MPSSVKCSLVLVLTLLSYLPATARPTTCTSSLEAMLRLLLLPLDGVLDHNIFEWFAAHGGLTRENGQRFREMVLSRGNTAPVGTFFTNFTGLTEPDMSSLLRFRGLTK